MAKKAKVSSEVDTKRKRGRPAGSKNKSKKEVTPEVASVVSDPRKPKTVTALDKKVLEANRSGGVLKVQCMSNLNQPLTIELGENIYRIRPKTPFTCLRSEYEILNEKIEGGLEFIGEVLEPHASKREAHLAECNRERQRFLKTVESRKKDINLGLGDLGNSELMMKIFSGSMDEKQGIDKIVDKSTLSKMLKTAQENGQVPIARLVRKRLLELEAVA